MRRAALALLAGCGPTPLGRGMDLGPAFRLSGPIDPAVEVSGDGTRAAVAWAWMDAGTVDGVVVEAPFEPLVYRYAIEVPAPPDPATGASPRPATLADGGATVLVGLPMLVEGSDPTALDLDPAGLLDWVTGARVELAGVFDPMPAAVAPGHVLGLAVLPGRSAARLAELPDWDPAGCRLDEVEEGLTLYRSEGDGCGGWAPIAPAGTRTEFQGIPLGPP